MSDTKENENKALTIFKEIEKRNINDTVKPKFELCFFDEMGGSKMNIFDAMKLAQHNDNNIKRKDWDFILYISINSFWIMGKNCQYKLTPIDILADDWEVME